MNDLFFLSVFIVTVFSANVKSVIKLYYLEDDGEEGARG